jgi:hypothetical protein
MNEHVQQCLKAGCSNQREIDKALCNECDGKGCLDKAPGKVLSLAPAIEPNEHLVSVLEGLLEDARSGEMQEIIGIGVRTNDEVVRFQTAGIYEHGIKVIGWMRMQQMGVEHVLAESVFGGCEVHE